MSTEMVQLFYAGASGVITRWRNPNGTWSAEENLGGTPIGPVVAVSVQGTAILDLFYVDTDNGICSRRRNPDGSWSAAQCLGGTVCGGITGSVVPGTDVVHIFHAGPGGDVITRWRDPNGSWSAERSLGGQVSGNGIAALTIPGTAVLQLFYRDGGGVSSLWRHPDGSWSQEESLGGAVNVASNVAVGVVPGSEVIQLFYRTTDNTVRSIRRNADGSWSAEQNLGGTAIGDIATTSVPGSDVLRLFYSGIDHAVWSRSRNADGSWSPEERVGGQVAAEGRIASVVVPDTDVLQLFYDGTKGASSLWRDPDGSWSAEQQLGGCASTGITAALVPFAVGRGLFVSVFGDQQHFTYRDASAQLQDAWLGSGDWNLRQLSDGAAAVSGEYVISTPGPMPAPGSPFVSVSDDQQHFTYRDGNGNVQDAWWDASGWHLQQINDADGTGATAPAVGELFVSAHNNEHHFAYLDARGGIHDVWFDGNNWHLQQINAAAGGPPAVGDLFVSVYDNQQHFTYRDGNGNVQDAWRDGTGWHLQQINDADGQGATAKAVGGLVVSAHNNAHHFAYLDARGGIHDVWFDGNDWHLQQINAGGPPAVGDLFVSVYDDQQHFTYRDGNGNVQDAWRDGGGWHLRQINDADGKGATVPGPIYIAGHHTLGIDDQPVKATAPAVGGLFVSAYNGEHHFAYLDAHGGIEDVWFDGNDWRLQQINASAGVTVSGEYPATGGPPAAG
jgi:hypothetical protein